MPSRPSLESRMGIMAAFIAASYVLGLIKLPSPVGSIALDSAPGYFLAAYLGPVPGGVVGTLGHLASAASAGFPLGYIHLAVAAQMFFWCLAFGATARAFNKHWALIPAGLLAVLLNGLAGPWMLWQLGVIPEKLAKGVMPFLTFASALNIAIASLAVISFAAKRRKKS